MKMVIGISVIALSIFLGTQFVPVYYANYEFEDSIKNEATLQTYTTKPESDIRDSIFKKAQELDIPIVKEDIKVVRVGGVGVGSLNIQAPYTVHLDLPLLPVDLNFDASTHNKSPF
jgi:phenolic acid decarboxylase